MKKIQSLERAMHILAIIDSLGGANGLGALEIARHAGLKTPTAHNFLQTFLALGYLEQTDRGKYRIAGKTRWLGWDGSKKNVLIQAARPQLARLAGELNETVVLTARSGRWWQTLLKYESRHGLVARGDLPMTENFYISATGRCILSRLPEAELQEILAGFRLPTPEEWPGAETLAGLRVELARIVRNRYELYQNSDDDLSGIGVAVPSLTNGAPGAVGVIIPTSRFLRTDPANIVALVLAAVERIH